MDSTNHKSVGFNATQPFHIQMDKTMDIVKALGDDIRKWNASARKELRYGGDVDVLDANHDIIGSAPKLALVVVSTTFRDYLENKPEATQVKIALPDVEDDAVAVLIKWTNTMVHNVSAKFGVGIPGFNVDLIKVRFAAHKLGMEKYISHFGRAYKDGLRYRTPPSEECALLERLAIGADDDLVNGAGARLAHLRRTRQFDAATLSSLTVFLNANAKMRAAVQAADSRSRRA
jgi:hypothetical protein